MSNSKIWLAIVIAILTATTSALGQKKNDRQLANLRGPVHEFTEFSYSAVAPGPQSPDSYRRYLQRLRFDAAGNIVLRVLIDEVSNRTEGHEDRVFGSDGRLRESVTWYSAAEGLKVYYSYGRNGRLSETKIHDFGGVLQLRTTFTYDADTYPTHETYYENGIAVSKTLFKYDSRGNILEMGYYLADGTKYNALAGPCAPAHRITFSYNPDNRIATKTTFDEDDVAVYAWTYHSYDNRGNPLMATYKTGNRTTTYTYRYEFDSYGNWVRSTARVETKEEAPTGRRLTFEEFKTARSASTMTEITERTIRYHQTR